MSEDKPNKGGAPLKNSNARKHGLYGIGLPKGCEYIRRQVSKLRKLLISECAAVHGQATPLQLAIVQSIARHETAARLAGKWLKDEGDDQPVHQRLALLDKISKATDARDKAISRLELDKAPATLDLYSRPRLGGES